MPLIAANGHAPSKANGHANGKAHGWPPKPPAAARAEPKRRQRTFARQQKAAERVASATTQVSSGTAEAASAAEQLRKAMTQIASGAAEAASAAEQSQRAVTRISTNIRQSAEAAGMSLAKTEALRDLLGAVNAQISASVVSVGRAAERQGASVGMVEELDRQAANIGEIVKAVARIADQTNLLALNAAIEAARAGQHGRGFAVVADEVRTLAETSEKSARDIQDLVAQIQTEVKRIAEGINASATAAQQEAGNGRAVAEQLEGIRGDMGVIVPGARDIRASAAEAEGAEAEGAAGEAQKGAEAISAAAQEQSAACEEAVKTVEQQTTALGQSEGAASELSDLADDLKNSTDIGKSAEEVASAAEELSAAVEEINRAAGEVMTAIEQISRGAQQQSAATQQSSAALAWIERGAQLSSQRASLALEKGDEMTSRLSDNAAAVERMIAGVEQSVRDNDASRGQINALEQVSRRIDKIVDAITTVSIQTSMLAVNGSIEAARAGEFGKGFMVVSTDIRNLARDSAENAERIKDLAKSVQDQIVAVRRDLEDTASLAKAEVEKSRVITANLASVTADMGLVLEGNRTISTGATDILASIEEAKRGVEQVSAAATQASQAAAEAAQAAREQSKGAEEMASAVEEIASLADELQTADTV